MVLIDWHSGFTGLLYHPRGIRMYYPTNNHAEYNCFTISLSCLDTVMYAPVSTVTRHRLSLTQPCVTRLGWVLTVMTVNSWWWALMCKPHILPFPSATARFPTVGHPLCLPLCCFSVAIQTFLPVPLCLSEDFLLVSLAGHLFLPPSHRDSYPRNGLAHYSSSTVMVFGLFYLLGAIRTPRMSWRSFLGVWLLGVRPAALGPAWEPRSPFSHLTAAAEFLCPVLLFHRRTSCLPPF
jgi:hypothetical protein